MAPRAPKLKVDDDDPLKPKTEKAKVGKTKSEKGEKTDNAKRDTKEKDRGGKVKPATGDEAMELITDYLRAQNRPYSATEVSANLHGKVSSSSCSLMIASICHSGGYTRLTRTSQVTKTVADKLLKEMEQSNQIMGKATNGDKKGSQWVFWALQVQAPLVLP